jgi:hypothetical protein
MYGIQGFYVGGGVDASGGGVYKKSTQQKLKASRARNANRLQQQRDQFQKDNKDAQRQTVEEFVRDSRLRRGDPLVTAREAERMAGRSNEFASDFQKLIGPAGSGTFLFTGNPRTQEFMKKYGLSDQDLINLRLSVTQPGFRKLGEKVFENVQERFPGTPSLFNVQDALSKFKVGMTPFDRLPSTRGGFMGGIEDLFAAGPFSSLADKLSGGSPMGSAGLAFGKTQGLEGDQLNQFASAIANNPGLYNQMMMTPEMQMRQFQQNLVNVERGLPRRSNNQEVKQEPDPITAAYNPAMNPFLNSGIGNFQFFV